MKVMFDVHGDDAALFAAFAVLREKPLVVVVFDSHLQELRGRGITWRQRRAETEAAMRILGAEVKFLGVSDAGWNRDVLRLLVSQFAPCEKVWAPAVEEDGNEHHNLIGQLADDLYPDVEHYMTYTRRGKSEGVPVPYEREWPLLKLRALACYESQILESSTVDHFLRPQYEYLAS